MFLDDGIGGNTDLDLAKSQSVYVRQSLIDVGFLLAEKKCDWVPKQSAVWLGHVFCFAENRLRLSDERIGRLKKHIDSILFEILHDSYPIIHVTTLASVIGQIISVQSVLGKYVSLRTRNLYNCISARISWNSLIRVSQVAIGELRYWRKSARKLNSRGGSLRHKPVIEAIVYCDASADGYGGYVEFPVVCPTESKTTIHGYSGKSNSSRVELRNVLRDIGGNSCKCHTCSSTVGFKQDPQNRVVCLFNTFLNVQSPEVSCNEQSAFCASDISASGHGDPYNIELPEASSVGQELGFCKGSTDGNIQVIDHPEASYKQNGFVEDEVHFNYWSDRCKIHVRVQDRISLGFNADSFTQEGIYNEACYFGSTSNGKGMDLCKAAEGTSESSNIVFKSEIFGSWSHEESLKSSTWRELEAMCRVIRSNLVILKASHIQIFSDNQNVEHILQAGSKVQELQDLSLDINKIFESNAISFSAKWIPRNENLLADHLSRCKDSDDWYVSEDVFKTLDRKWGPHSIDRFATHYNRKCERLIPGGGFQARKPWTALIRLGQGS